MTPRLSKRGRFSKVSHILMNILFLSTRSPYPLVSGHSLRTYHILRGAAEKHKVTLITFIQLEDELRSENLAHLRSFCEQVYPFRIPIDMSKAKFATAVLLNLFSMRPFVACKYDVKMMRRKIREIIKRECIDLVHVDLLPLSVYMNEYKHLPKILVNHNVESVRLCRWFQTEPNILKKTYLGIQWLKLRSFERKAMNKFDCGIVVSEIDKNMLKQLGIKTKLFVVPNGTDTDFFKPGKERKVENLVFWLGHMDVHTNRDAVLYFWRKIYPILQKKYPQVKMTFVGTAPPKEMADAARKDVLVKVTGFVDDVRPYLDQAAVMVVPIRIGSGTRLKILDAMAMGKAIVSTSVGCEGLNVTNRKNILIADDPESFADNVIEILKNPGLKMRLEKDSLRLAKTYDWKAIRQKQESVYQYVIGGAKS